MSNATTPSTTTPFPSLKKIKTDFSNCNYASYMTQSSKVPSFEDLVKLRQELEQISKDVDLRVDDLKKNYGSLQEWHKLAYPDSTVNKLFKKAVAPNNVNSTVQTPILASSTPTPPAGPATVPNAKKLLKNSANTKGTRHNAKVAQLTCSNVPFIHDS
jgi:hypothetical protein